MEVMFYSRETENKNYKRVTLPDKSSLSIFAVVGFVKIGRNKMALRTARRLVVRGRAARQNRGNPGPRRIGQVGVVESSAHRTVPLARISALSRQT